MFLKGSFTKATTNSSNTHGSCNLGGKILRNNGNTRHKQTACTDTNTEGLCENNLVVFFTQREHHLPEYDEKGPGSHQQLEVTRVVYRSRQCADEEQ